MANNVFKSVAELILKLEGADKATNDLNKVVGAQKRVENATEATTKKSTRQANESTNTARAFSAQASGLGGLVAAYAGAAATIFALQQSFSALSAAARSDAVVTGVKALATTLGQDGSKIIATVKEITRGQLSLTEAAQNAGIALSSGLSGDQIEQIADIATRASKALGRDLTDSYQRLVRGIGKLEPELLDELGIFSRIEPAVERYAAKIGKASNSLTQFERQQAFATAVLEEGLTKFRNVDTSISDSSQNLNRLVANISDLALKIGQVLTTILDPIVRFFNDDIANLAALVAVLGTLVFGKLGQVASQGLEDLNKKVLNFGSKVTSSLTRGMNEYSDAINKAQVSLKGLGTAQALIGTSEEKKKLKEVFASIRSGEIAPSDLGRAREEIAAQIQRETARQETQRKNIVEIEDRIRQAKEAGKTGTKADVNNLTVSTSAIESSKSRVETLTQLDKDLDVAFTKTTKSASTASNAINAFSNGITRTITFLGRFISILGGVATGFAILEIAGGIFERITGISNPFARGIEYIAGAIQLYTQNLRDSRQVSEAFYSSLFTDAEKLKNSVSNLKIFTEAMKEARNALGRVVSNVQTAQSIATGTNEPLMLGLERNRQLLAEQQAAIEAIAPSRTTRALANLGQALFGSPESMPKSIRAAVEAIRNFNIQRENIEKEYREKMAKQEPITSATSTLSMAGKAREAELKALTQSIDRERQAIIDTINKTNDTETISKLYLQLKLLEQGAEVLRTTFDKFATQAVNTGQTASDVFKTTENFISKITKELGISVTEGWNLFNTGVIEAGKNGSVLVKVFDRLGDTINTLTIPAEELSRTLNGIAAASLKSRAGINRLNELSSQKSVTQRQLQGELETQNAIIDNLKAFATTQGNEDTQTAVFNLIRELEAAVVKYRELEKAIGGVESLSKSLLDNYSSAINAAGKLAETGRVNSKGVIAIIPEEERANQLNFFNQIDAALERLKAVNVNLKGEFEAATIAQQQRDKVRLDFAVQFIRNTREIVRAENEKLIQLQDQNTAIIQQNRIQAIQLANAEALVKQTQELESLRFNVERNNLAVENEAKRVQLYNTAEDIAIAANERRKKELEVQKNLRQVEADRLKLTIDRVAADKASAITREQELMSRFAGFGSESSRGQLELTSKIAELEAALAKTVVDYQTATQSTNEAAEKDVLIARSREIQAKNDLEAVSIRAQADTARASAERDIRVKEIEGQREAARNNLDAQLAQNTLAVLNIQSQEAASLRELEITKIRFDQLKIQADIFNNHIKGLAKLFAELEISSVTRGQNLTANELATQRGSIEQRFTDALADSIKTFSQDMPDAIQKQERLVKENADRQIEGLRANSESIRRVNRLEETNFNRQVDRERDLTSLRIRGIDLTRMQEEDKAKITVQNAEQEVKLAGQNRDIARSQQELDLQKLKQDRQRQLEELEFLKKIKELSGDSTFLALSDSIDAFKKTTGEFITSLAIDVVNGTKSAKDAFRQFLFSLATEIQKAVVKRTITDPIVTAIGSVTDNVLKSFAGFSLPGVLGSRSGPLYSAIGGSVKNYAVGGGVDGGRDRVPALLEPGEFVIRRPAAQALGEDMLKMLNAMGPNKGKKFKLFDLGGGAFDGYQGADSSSFGGYDGFSGVNDASIGLSDVTRESFATNMDFMNAVTRATDTINSDYLSGANTLSASIDTFDYEAAGVSKATGMFADIVNSITKSILDPANFSTPLAFGITPTALYGIAYALGRLFKGEPLTDKDFDYSYPDRDFKSIGGMVKHMAIGGSVRDRIPALLEPGEFVLRRPAAMAIGGAVLNQMNANGQLPVGNVSVNVINQGTPQAAQGQPVVSRQGENIIIDLVVKDIKNNGPIRQTLKGMR